MVSTTCLQSAVDLIEQSKSILMTTHTKPDGDACGCMVAMCDILESLGKSVQPLMLTPVPEWYGFLFEQKVPVLGADITTEQLQQRHFDLLLIVDTNSRSQLGKFTQYVDGNEKPVLIIDHHATGDGLGTIDLTDSTAAAAGQVLLELLKGAGWPITERIAEALFIAIATDTRRAMRSNRPILGACGGVSSSRPVLESTILSPVLPQCLSTGWYAALKMM